MSDRFEATEALGRAIDGGSVDDVRKAIADGADVNFTQGDGDATFLMSAAERGDLDIVKCLVAAGADVNSQAEDLSGDVGDVGLVFALLYAAVKRHRAVYDYLAPLTNAKLRARAQQELGTRKKRLDRNSKALLAAAGRGDVSAIAALLQSGANVDAMDRNGLSPLLHAVAPEPPFAPGFPEAVDRLLEAGADPNIQTKEGLYGLMLADDPTIARALIDAGADVNARDRYDRTALMFSALRGSTGVVRVLIEADADPHVADNEGRTALMYAAESGQSDAVAMLVGLGDINARDRRGRTALYFAKHPQFPCGGRQKDKAGVLEILTQQGAVES